MHEVSLGPVARFTALPAEIDLGHDSYYLVRNDDGWKLLSRLCPHAGGFIQTAPREGLLFCPSHFWMFDARTGACTNVDGVCLDTVPVVERDGELWAQRPAVN